MLLSSPLLIRHCVREGIVLLESKKKKKNVKKVKLALDLYPHELAVQTTYRSSSRNFNFIQPIFKVNVP